MASKKKPRTPVRHPIGRAFGDYLIEERKRQGRSRYQVGKTGEVGDTTLKALEDMGCDPKLSTFVQACEALGKNPATVLRHLLAVLAGQGAPL